MRKAVWLLATCVLAPGLASVAQTSTLSPYQQLARSIFQELVQIKSTESGVGSTPAAEAVARRLLAAGYPATEARWQFEILDAPPSALRPDLVTAVDHVAQQLWPGVAVMPVLDVVTSDSVYPRGAGIPTYGIGGVFVDGDDVSAHGRDERIRVRDFYAGLEFYDRFVKTLADR
jgi:acetylornithine deacetylase/succinyl-diaminopimelate desuccinylase-like protein